MDGYFEQRVPNCSAKQNRQPNHALWQNYFFNLFYLTATLAKGQASKITISNFLQQAVVRTLGGLPEVSKNTVRLLTHNEGNSGIKGSKCCATSTTLIFLVERTNSKAFHNKRHFTFVSELVILSLLSVRIFYLRHYTCTS